MYQNPRQIRLPGGAPQNTARLTLPGRFLRWRNALGVDGVQLNPEARHSVDATSESTKDTRRGSLPPWVIHGEYNRKFNLHMMENGSLLDLRHDDMMLALQQKKK